MAQYFYVQRMNEMKATIENQEQQFQCVHLDIHAALDVTLTLQLTRRYQSCLFDHCLPELRISFMPGSAFTPLILHSHYVRPHFES